MHNSRPSEDILTMLEESVAEPGHVTLKELLDLAIDERIPAHDIRSALIQGMERLRSRIMSSDLGLPDFLLSIDGVLVCLERLSGMDNAASMPDIPLVIGVVKGDPHDLGKNIIAGIYRAYGYRVIDLGRDVSCEDFVQGVLASKARVL